MSCPCSPTELFWTLKSLLTSPQEANQERVLLHFEQNHAPMLKTGGVFALVDPGEVDLSSENASLVGTAVLQVTKLLSPATGSSEKKKVKPYQVLVRLVRATPSSKQTYLEWSTLELEANKPKFTGRVPLYKVQTIKEHKGGIAFMTPQGQVLFECKCLTEQASIEAGKWVAAWQSAMVALAAPIEDEAAAASGFFQRNSKLIAAEEKLKASLEEKSRQRQALGQVTMAHTAKIMAERQDTKQVRSLARLPPRLSGRRVSSRRRWRTAIAGDIVSCARCGSGSLSST